MHFLCAFRMGSMTDLWDGGVGEGLYGRGSYTKERMTTPELENKGEA